MTTTAHTWKSSLLCACRTGLASKVGRRLFEASLEVRLRWALLLLSTVAVLAGLSVAARSQSLSESEGTTGTAVTPTTELLEPTYMRPTRRIEVNNYLFDAYGPYPITFAAFTSGIDQLNNTPPEWHQGAEGFGKRFGSDFAMAAVGTTTRFGLARVLKEDTLYYRCECSGLWPRMGHAVISTFTARHGEDGHRAFSLPLLLSPYAGSMTGVYGWYPSRYGAKDAFRIGNYSLLTNIGWNIALEFFHSGRHSLLARAQLSNRHDVTAREPRQ